MRVYNSLSAVAFLVLLACLMSVNIQAQSASEVEITAQSFQPNVLTVPVGTTVVWINDDTADHTVTSDDDAFHSGYIAPGGRFSHLFDSPGRYSYHCNIHPFARGIIQVTSDLSAAYAAATTSKTYRSAAPQGAIQSTAAQYSDYYRMISGSTPSAHITKPQRYNIQNGAPDSLYFRDQEQAVPYSQYQAHAGYIGNSIWIQGASNWIQYAAVPKRAFLSLMSISPREGDGYLYETSPSGKVTKNYYHFFPYSQIGFYADEVGQYTLGFSMNGQMSNSIVIDVSDYNPSSYQQQNYQQGYQQSVSNEPAYQQAGYNQPEYQQSENQQASYQHMQQIELTKEAYSPEYSSFWETSAVKKDSNGRLTLDGIEGIDYDLQASSSNVLTRGLLYNGVSYILIANPGDASYTITVNPQVGSWNMQSLQVKYGNLMAAKAGNLLQITVPAFQSGLIILQPQKQRYSISVGPKPAYSFHAGPKPAYSFHAGPKLPYSFRIGY
jgi:plastocyanin